MLIRANGEPITPLNDRLYDLKRELEARSFHDPRVQAALHVYAQDEQTSYEEMLLRLALALSEDRERLAAALSEAKAREANIFKQG